MIQEKNEKLELIKRELSAKDAYDSMNALMGKITQQLNLEMLQSYEKGHDGNGTESISAQIANIKKQQAELNERIKQAEKLGCDIQMSLKFEIALIK